MFYFFVFGCQSSSSVPVAVEIPEEPVLTMPVSEVEAVQEHLFSGFKADTLLSHTQYFSVDGVVYDFFFFVCILC